MSPSENSCRPCRNAPADAAANAAFSFLRTPERAFALDYLLNWDGDAAGDAAVLMGSRVSDSALVNLVGIAKMDGLQQTCAAEHVFLWIPVWHMSGLRLGISVERVAPLEGFLPFQTVTVPERANLIIFSVGRFVRDVETGEMVSLTSSATCQPSRSGRETVMLTHIRNEEGSVRGLTFMECSRKAMGARPFTSATFARTARSYSLIRFMRESACPSCHLEPADGVRCSCNLRYLSSESFLDHTLFRENVDLEMGKFEGDVSMHVRRAMSDRFPKPMRLSTKITWSWADDFPRTATLLLEYAKEDRVQLGKMCVAGLPSASAQGEAQHTVSNRGRSEGRFLNRSEECSVIDFNNRGASRDKLSTTQMESRPMSRGRVTCHPPDLIGDLSSSSELQVGASGKAPASSRRESTSEVQCELIRQRSRPYCSPRVAPVELSAVLSEKEKLQLARKRRNNEAAKKSNLKQKIHRNKVASDLQQVRSMKQTLDSRLLDLRKENADLKSRIADVQIAQWKS